jgi:hopanoid biosynthesis associated protein HpnK
LLTGRDGRFIDDLALAGFRWFASARVRNQLAEEISAQFEAFAATGLMLDHVNVHKHLHLHPTVLRLIIAIGRRFGMLALRIPEEPRRILRRAEPGRPVAPSYLGPMLHWMRLQIRARRLIVPDHCFGLAWSGAMTEERILALIPHLPQGLSELYAHPATRDGADMPHAAKGYRYREELAALTSPRVRAAIERSGVTLTRYSAEQRLAQPAAGRAARA